MKKIFYLLLCGIIVFNFTACGKKVENTNNETSNKAIVEADKNKGENNTENKDNKSSDEDKVKQGKENVGKKVELFFSDDQAMYLNKEVVEVKEVTPEELIKKLQEGPKNSKNTPVIPKDLKIKVEVKGSTAYVDLGENVAEKLNGGSAGESMLIYSIVDTLVLNKDLGIEKVQFLVGGKVEESITGHLDVSVPLKPDMDMIKK